MKPWLVGGVLGLVALAGEGQAAEPVAEVARKKGWLTDYPTALAAARRTGKPLMVVFRCLP